MATAAGSSSHLLDLVRCDLCLEKYNESDRLPKLLNCSHTFCLACVQRYYKSKLKNKLPCPNCRIDFTVPRDGVKNLNTNIMVIDLLDHLAPFTVDDTDEGVIELSAVSKDKISEESGSTMCPLHPKEKCDFYCDNCGDPLCPDCIVSITEGPHKTHKIRKLRDVLTTYSTQHKDAIRLITNIKVKGKQRTEELLEELVLSRYSLVKEAKSKRDKAHEEADKWYHKTTAAISKVYDKLHSQILQFMSKIDLQEMQQSLEKIDFQKIDQDFKQAKSFLDELQSFVTSYKKSTTCPIKFWSLNAGKITDDFTLDLGRITKPTLKLPDVNGLPYTIKTKHKNVEIAKLNVGKQSKKQPGIRLLSDIPMQPGFDLKVGLTTHEAVLCFDDDSFIKKIAFTSNKIIDLYKKSLPGKLDFSCIKYILNNNSVLLRFYDKGPSYILNSQLELVSRIQENYGYIIGAESANWVAFVNEDRIIQIYDLEKKQLLQKFTPPAGVRWWGHKSVCRNLDSQLTAVVDYHSDVLCIYDHDGRHLRTHNLQFLPRSNRAILCNQRHLYVVSDDPVSVFVLSWSGQLVTMLDSQQLGIPEGQFIWNIAVDEDEFTIVVVGNNGVSSFKTFQCV